MKNLIMSGINTAMRAIDVSADGRSIRMEDIQGPIFFRKSTAFLWLSILIAILSIFLGSTGVHASTQDDLDIRIQNLEEVSSSLTVDVPSAVNHLKNETNLEDGPLLVGDYQLAIPGETIEWSISLVASSPSVVAVQTDLILPSSFTLVSVTTGPASVAAQKTVSFSAPNGRFVIAGLNQNVIGSGVIAFVTLTLDPQLPKRIYPISLINPVASDASGNAVPIFATSGIVEIQ